MCRHIADSAVIGNGCVLGENVVIEGEVQIGAGTHVGHNVVIYKGTRIGKNVYIEAGSILGRVPQLSVSSYWKLPQELPPLEVGDGCIIGINAILYAGTKIGKEVMIADLASVREQNIIGDKSIIGRTVIVEPQNEIGIHVTIHGGTMIGGCSKIEDYVFIGTEVSTCNDNYMGRGPAGHWKGQHIKRGARVGSNSSLLPGVVIGEEAVVAVGAVVTKDVPDRKVVMGIPARVVKDVPREEVSH